MFFGREEIVSATLEELLERGFLAMVGASGSGKSSLARAGVDPWIASGARGGRRCSDHAPGSAPAEALARSTRPLSRRSSSSTSSRRRSRSVRTTPAGAASSTRSTDLYESGATSDRRRRSGPTSTAAAPSTRGRAAAGSPRINGCSGRCSPTELRRAIEGPARVAGFSLEPGLVEPFLADAAGEPGALPLSRMRCRSHGRAGTDGRSRSTGYQDAGGVPGARSLGRPSRSTPAARHDERVDAAGPPPAHRLGEGTEDTRRRVPLARARVGPARTGWPG